MRLEVASRVLARLLKNRLEKLRSRQEEGSKIKKKVQEQLAL
jgi:hypothetical protein